jgi:hypothetical protein
LQVVQVSEKEFNFLDYLKRYTQRIELVPGGDCAAVRMSNLHPMLTSSPPCFGTALHAQLLCEPMCFCCGATSRTVSTLTTVLSRCCTG